MALSRLALPAQAPVAAAPGGPRGDLPLRMLAAAGLVLTLTALADRLGPNLSGYLTAFPLVAAILGAFTHVQRGPAAVAAFFAGFIPALHSFACFCAVLSATLAPLGLPLALAAALTVQGAAHSVILWRMRGARLSETRGERPR